MGVSSSEAVPPGPATMTRYLAHPSTDSFSPWSGVGQHRSASGPNLCCSVDLTCEVYANISNLASQPHGEGIVPVGHPFAHFLLLQSVSSKAHACSKM